MDVPTRSLVTSWMGLLGSASLTTIKHYLILYRQSQYVHKTRGRLRKVPLHQCAGLRRGLGTNPCRELYLTMSPPLFDLSTGSVRMFPCSLSARAASQSAANCRQQDSLNRSAFHRAVAPRSGKAEEKGKPSTEHATNLGQARLIDRGSGGGGVRVGEGVSLARGSTGSLGGCGGGEERTLVEAGREGEGG